MISFLTWFNRRVYERDIDWYCIWFLCFYSTFGIPKTEDNILYQVLDLTILACSIQTNIGPPWYYISDTISRKLSVSLSWFYYIEPFNLPAVCVHSLCFPLLFFYLTLSLTVELNTLTVTVIAVLSTNFLLGA